MKPLRLLSLLLCMVAASSWAYAMRISSPADFTRVDSLVKQVSIAPGIRQIPPYAFAECRQLTTLTFEAGSRCTSLGEGAFYRCEKLTDAQLPASVADIGRYAFAWCSALAKASFPGAVKIRAHAFAYCFSLDSITLPTGLKSVGNNAFSHCESLKAIAVPPSVTELESYAFSDCLSLRRATLPANPSLLGELIFSGCSSLEEIVEPSPAVPPFDCNSFIFEPDDTAAYLRCRLLVNPSALHKYAEAPGWKLFHRIEKFSCE